MKYSIAFTKQPTKYFQNLPVTVLKNIQEKLLLLANGEFEKLDIKPMLPKKVNKYRLRIGKYRIIYEKNDTVLTILVLRMETRGDIYNK